MRLEVRFEGTTLFEDSVPICRVDRSDQPRDSKILKFTFHPDRQIVWSGNGEANNIIDAGQEIEGNVWQAGAEPDALIFGVSFAVKDRFVMNTLHVAQTANRAETEIAKGVSVITRPIKGTSP